MIAILLSTYNGELYLREQLDSLLTQSYADWQLYVRDDGSKDKTIDILQEYASKHPTKIHIIENINSNLGAGESFMYLLKVIEADYYMFSDQDDVWMNDKIEKTFRKLRQMENQYGKDTAMGVFTDLTVVNKNLNIIMPSLWKGDNRHPEYIHNFYKQWTNRHASYGCTQIFNKATKQLVLPYKQFEGVQGAHDNWIEYILIKFGKYDYLDEPTILYRQHDTNVVGGNFGDGYTSNIYAILHNPLLLFQQLKKDYNRVRLMPFKVSYIKILWYRFYQTILTIIKL